MAQVPLDGYSSSSLPVWPLLVCRWLARSLGLWELLASGVDGGGWKWESSPEYSRQRTEVQVPPGGVGRTGGDGVLSSSWRKPQAQRGGEGRGAMCWVDLLTMPLPLQVSPTSPSKPTLLYWRTRYPWRRVKPLRSFISSWMAGGSSGRRVVPSLSPPLHLS